MTVSHTAIKFESYQKLFSKIIRPYCRYQPYKVYPFSIAQDQGRWIWGGTSHLLSAPSDLAHRIGLPKLWFSYVEWMVTRIEPRTFRLQGETTTKKNRFKSEKVQQHQNTGYRDKKAKKCF